MPDLSFEVTGVSVPPDAISPLLLFTLQITNADAAERIHAVILRCQILILPWRHHTTGEQARLVELFGEPSRWGETARSFLWSHTTAATAAFTGRTQVNIVVPCTYDFDVAAAKYFDALEDGEIPLLFLFSGTVFYAGPTGALQVGQIGRMRGEKKDAAFDLPVARWREMMAHYFPNSAWIRLRKDTFDRLYRYKMSRGLPTWEDALEQILPPEGSPERAERSDGGKGAERG